jgi:mycofactocin glycosyltransferase
VVVPFLGTETELKRIVVAMEELHRIPGDELIVADNRTTDPGVGQIGEVVIHPAGGVRSPGFARNRGAAKARNEWLIFIDADTDPDVGLLDFYFEPPPGERTGVLGGGIIDFAAGSVNGAAPSLAARHAAARAQMDHRVTLERQAFPYAQSANCAVRRSAFIALGGFGEGIRAAEDADLCFRMAEAGWAVEVRAGAVVRHRTRQTLSGSLTQLAHHGSGAAWCNRRHPGSFPPPSPWGLGKRMVRDGGRAVWAYSRGDREQAAFAVLDVAEAGAFEFGRLLSNRAPR